MEAVPLAWRFRLCSRRVSRPTGLLFPADRQPGEAMNMDLNEPRTYDLVLSDDLPGEPSVGRQFYFPPGTFGGGKDGIVVHVKPRAGQEWFGIFGFGNTFPGA